MKNQIKELKNKKYNKKAQTGDTASWIIATFIILFILVLFLAATLLMAGKEKISREGIKITKEKIQPKIDFELTKNFLGFLNNPVEIDGKEMPTKDLIIGEPESDENKKKFEKFIELSKEFAKKNTKVGKDELYNKVWFRVYEKNELISQYPDKDPNTISREPLQYDKYQFFIGQSSMTEDPCNPDIKKSIGKNIHSLHFFVLVENKKIAICAEYN